MSATYLCRPADVARGCALVPLTLVWDLSSIPSRYLIDWGACPENVPLISEEGHYPTRYNSAITFRELTTYRRLYLFTKTRLNFLIKAHCSLSNAATSKNDLFSASATRERGRGLAVAFHHGQGGGGEGSAYANLSPDLREYTPSTLDPHISGQGEARREI